MKKLNEKIEKASEIYGEQTIIRTLINAIPYVGGSLDLLLSAKGQTYIIKRIERFLNELQNEVAQLDESKINKVYLESEEGFDLIIKALNSASKTRQAEKLLLYAKIIKGAITIGNDNEEDDPELYLKIIEELSIKELRVAKCLFELKEIKQKTPEEDNPAGDQDEMTNDAWWLSKNYPEFDKDQLISILVRLERTGLIKELVGTFIGYGGGQYLINPLFRDFMNFINMYNKPK